MFVRCFAPMFAMAQNHWLDAHRADRATGCVRLKREVFLFVRGCETRGECSFEKWRRRRLWRYQQELLHPTSTYSSLQLTRLWLDIRAFRGATTQPPPERLRVLRLRILWPFASGYCGVRLDPHPQTWPQPVYTVSSLWRSKRQHGRGGLQSWLQVAYWPRLHSIVFVIPMRQWSCLHWQTPTNSTSSLQTTSLQRLGLHLAPPRWLLAAQVVGGRLAPPSPPGRRGRAQRSWRSWSCVRLIDWQTPVCLARYSPWDVSVECLGPCRRKPCVSMCCRPCALPPSRCAHIWRAPLVWMRLPPPMRQATRHSPSLSSNTFWPPSTLLRTCYRLRPSTRLL